MILTQDHLGKFKVTEWKNAVSGYISLMEKPQKFLFHKKIANDLRVCHNFDPSFLWKVQGHCKKKNY